MSVHTFGGVPGPGPGEGPRSRSGGSQVQVQGCGGVPGPGLGGPRSRSGGYPVSDLGGYPVSVKGKIFDTRFGLIHVQTGKKIFCRGTPPPSKGNNFIHQIWLDTCSDWGKKFLSRDPPPPNIKDLLWLRGGRYASCVHAGGLSFYGS